ncbi:MAG: ATP-binding protein [Bacteroidales bacterium]|nr:ATP-binding protein [Bacteroidales bacterium]
MGIIGRKKEIAELKNLYNSGRAELVAIYGRRRVGKTFLVDEVFAGKITFRHAGLSPVDASGKKNLMADQLKHFYHSLLLHGMKKSHVPDSWLEAFFMLEMYLQSIDNGGRMLLFFDELPWMDTPKSGFLTAFEGFWNTWACHRHNLMLVVCGSANSWVQDKLINNHGGLYGRTTYEIKLAPFTLGECAQFFRSRGVKLSRYDVVQSYMMLGGIPYYLGYFEAKNSLPQNIDKLFFGNTPKLRDEYSRLFSSVFTNPEVMMAIVDFLGTRHSGYTRAEILQHFGWDDSGCFSSKIKALIASDFVMEYVPFGKGKRATCYKLIDPFCFFCQKYVNGKSRLDADFWLKNQASQSVVSWRGVAFEEVCMAHVAQIKKALGVSGVISTQSAWALKGDDETEGTQIDLLINRNDNVLNMCEMKFYADDFTITKAYHQKLMNRERLLMERLPKRTVIHSTLITTCGLTYNEYSDDFTNVVTINDLFAD